MIDFIIVGQGLAANVLAHTFHNHQLSFKVIGSPELSRSSLVAAGIWNPVVFKRLTSSWLAHQTIPLLNIFYSGCEKKMNKTFLFNSPIIKPFIEEQEKRLWLQKSKNELDEFLGAVSADNTVLQGCNFSGEYGLVKQSGHIDTSTFLNETCMYYNENFIQEVFDYSLLKIESLGVKYKDVSAKNIIFCEGHLIKNNPFFNWVPMKPAKGEILTIESKGLQLNKFILNKGAFILETKENNFKTGATYEWDDLTEKPTQKAKKELSDKLVQLITSEYTVLKHEAGIRPSSIDRRPVIGRHPLYAHFFVFNGLGTKGVMLAPYFAENFVLFYLQKKDLNYEADVKRFYKLYKSE